MKRTARVTDLKGVPKAVLGAEEFNDDFFAELDRAFETIQMVPKEKKAKKRSKKSKTNEAAQMQQTYLEVARVHLRPVLRYLKAIDLGVASKDLCEVVHFVIGPMISKTRNVGLVEQTKALVDFQRALKEVVRQSGRKIAETNRQKLCETFLPVRQSFGLEFRGHSTAVVNLLGFFKVLRRKKDVTQSMLQKLFAIGIPSLTMLRKTSLTELSSLSGIPMDKISSLRGTARRFTIASLL